MKSFKFLLTILTLIIFITPFGSFVKAETLQEKLRRLQEEISGIQGEKSKLQSQINSNNYSISGYSTELSKLYGEAQIYQKELDELNLQISEIEVNIEITDQNIKKAEKEISDKEANITDLEKESNTRVKNSYYNFRLYGSTDSSSSLSFLSNINNYFKDSQYKELIQADTNDIINQLNQLKEKLIIQKTELAQQLVDIKKERELVVIKQTEVSKKNDELQAKMAIFNQRVQALSNQNAVAQNQFKQYTQEEAEKRRQANAVQLAIANSYTSISTGTFILEGTIIGLQGCTGLCTGPHLHFMVYENGSLRDPCAYLSGGVCGYGSGDRVQWPLKPVASYTSGYGNRCFNWNGLYCDFHNGIDIIGTYSTAPVYSAHSGYLAKGTDSYGAKYIIICENPNCNQGIKTGYWHLSSF